MRSLKEFGDNGKKIKALKKKQQKYLDLRNSNRSTKRTKAVYTQKALEIDQEIEGLKQ